MRTRGISSEKGCWHRIVGIFIRLPFRRLSSSLLALQMPFRTSVTIEEDLQVSFINYQIFSRSRRFLWVLYYAALNARSCSSFGFKEILNEKLSKLSRLPSFRRVNYQNLPSNFTISHFYLILLLFLSSFAKISPFQNFAIVSYFSETNRPTWDSPDTDLGGRYPRCIPSHLCCHTVFYIAVPYANLITQHITEIHESPERVFDFLKETETDRKSICICMHTCVCVSVVVRKREGERRGKDGFLLRGWKFGKTFHNRRDILDQPARQR